MPGFHKHPDLNILIKQTRTKPAFPRTVNLSRPPLTTRPTHGSIIIIVQTIKYLRLKATCISEPHVHLGRMGLLYALPLMEIQMYGGAKLPYIHMTLNVSMLYCIAFVNLFSAVHSISHSVAGLVKTLGFLKKDLGF